MPVAGAVLLTGGTGARFGGADKAALRVGGQRLLERALAAVANLTEVVVVGDPVPGVRSVREQPPGGGPAAGLLAGVDALPPRVEMVVALAVDMPLVTPATLDRLLAAASTPDHDGALLVDGGGRPQWLCGAYDRAALSHVPAAERDGLSLRALLAPLRLREVAAEGREAVDVDTAEDLARVDAWLCAETGCRERP